MNLVRFKKPSNRFGFPSIMDDFFNTSLRNLGDLDNFFARPSTNILEHDKGYTIELAVPGINKKDVEIKVEKDQLVISSVKEQNEETAEDNYTRREFNYSSFSQSFHLPESIDRNNVKATYQDGILRINLEKLEHAKNNGAKTIEIE